MQRQLVALACSGLLMTLAACGGGGEPIGGDTVFVKPTAAVTPASTDTTTPTTDTGSTDTAGSNTGSTTGDSTGSTGSTTTPTTPTTPAITQTLNLATSSATLVSYTMAAASSGLADTFSLSDGTALTQTLLGGSYVTKDADGNDVVNAVTLRVTYAPGNTALYILGLTIGDNGTQHQCVSSGWSSSQLADPSLAADSTPPTCDGTVTIDATARTVVASKVSTLSDPTDTGAAVLANFAVTLPAP